MTMQGYFITSAHKGYIGRAEYDAEADSFHGELLGIRDVITFAGKTPKEIQAEFQASVDDYLDWCKRRGKQPNKPFSGNILVRTTPELHRSLSALAEARGKSLNALVVDCLESATGVDAQRKPRRAAVKANLLDDPCRAN